MNTYSCSHQTGLCTRAVTCPWKCMFGSLLWHTQRGTVADFLDLEPTRISAPENTHRCIQNLHNYYHNHYTAFCLGLCRWAGTRKINHSGFCWSRHDGVAVASAEPYASYLHFAPEDNHTSTSSVRFLRAGCSSCLLYTSDAADE